MRVLFDLHAEIDTLEKLCERIARAERPDDDGGIDIDLPADVTARMRASVEKLADAVEAVVKSFDDDSPTIFAPADSVSIHD